MLELFGGFAGLVGNGSAEKLLNLISIVRTLSRRLLTAHWMYKLAKTAIFHIFFFFWIIISNDRPYCAIRKKCSGIKYHSNDLVSDFYRLIFAWLPDISIVQIFLDRFKQIHAVMLILNQIWPNTPNLTIKYLKSNIDIFYANICIKFVQTKHKKISDSRTQTISALDHPNVCNHFMEPNGWLAI